MKELSWGIVMTVKEPRALLLTNLAWHLGTGAAEIHVYLDDPDDPIAAQLEALPRVRVTRCDAEYWSEVAPIKRKPSTIRRRQSINANHAQRRCGCDWLIHMDADEFLVQSSPLGRELAYVAELDCEVFFAPRERIYIQDAPQETFFSGMFRSSTKGVNPRRDGVVNDKIIYGDHLPLLLHGVLGHSAGKCAVPRDQGFEIGIHWAYRGKNRKRAARYKSNSTHLLHFDGLTPLNWLMKLLRYADYDPSELSIADHRRAQIEIISDIAHDPQQILEFHNEMKVFDQTRLDRLRGFGILDETPFDPRPMVEAQLGWVPDLSPRAFDKSLVAANPALELLFRALYPAETGPPRYAK